MSHSQGWWGCDPLQQFSEKTAQKIENSLEAAAVCSQAKRGAY